jgi:N-acyl-D-aspartate/D-glutamate deacylase
MESPMSYDLVIRNGFVVDGSGLPRYRADVGVNGDTITRVGRIRERAGSEIDAEGRVVTPGFVDGHTHMDAQLFWDPVGSCAAYHGVTSVVMGNCGFSLAPARASESHLVLRNLERAEDISGEAMAAGVEWTWHDFASYLDAVDRAPKAINYAAYVGHSALRTYVMGERAFEESGSPDDVEAMATEMRAALRAGAIGFTTSRAAAHETSDDRPVASRFASWDQVRALVGVMGEEGGGIFEIPQVEDPVDDGPPIEQADFFARLRALALETGVTVTFGLIIPSFAPDFWRPQLELIDETVAGGGSMFGQSHARELATLVSFATKLPFDSLDEWKALRSEPLPRQAELLRDAEVRRRLVHAVHEGAFPRAVGPEMRAPDFEWIRPLFSTTRTNPSVAELASARGVDPVEAMIDLALEADLGLMFQQVFANKDQDDLATLLRYPRGIMTFSDSGAHATQIMDSSLQTYLLSHWVRERETFAFEQAVRMITLAPATAWGFSDRGLVREGMRADLNVLDPDTIAPAMPELVHDLPAGAPRLFQKSTGIDATIVGGEVTLSAGEPTGATPGRLLRGPLAARRS